MKSIMAFLPLAGLAFAQGQCGSASTLTETTTEKITITVQATSQPVSSAIVTPDTTAEATKPSPPPEVPYYPIGNTTSNGTVHFPTHTPYLPTTLVYTPSDISSSSAEKTKTVYVVPSPIGASSSTSAAATESTSPTAPNAKNTAEDTTIAATSVAGTASFYGGNLNGGACSFSTYTLPSGLFGTAFGGNWDASQCGACVSVTGPNGNTIKAMIVDQCPECPSNKLDLFENAFVELADRSAGIIDITYSIVPCDITSPIVLKNKEGTSPYWFSMQVINSNVAVSKLEVSTDGGSSWKSTTRMPYNFFENSSGFGTDTVDVKVTSVDGESIVVNGVSVAASSSKAAASNFS